MREEKCVVTLDSQEQRLMVKGLTGFRNDAIREGKPTEDVDNLILKVIDAPKMGTPWNRRFRGERSRSGVIELLPKAKAKDTELAATKKWGRSREGR